MKLFKPRSILQLTVIGFLAVSGILITALVITVVELGRMSRQSQQIVSESVRAANASRSLIEIGAALERNARQFEIIGDDELLHVYKERRQRFLAAIDQVRSLAPGSEAEAALDTLAATEARAFAALTAPQGERIEVLYPEVFSAAYGIADLVGRRNNARLEDLRQRTEKTQYLLTVQAALLAGTALVLAAIFTTLITRPLSQIEQAIGRIGSGAYKVPIRISGPKDLVQLGGQLEWLRARLERLEHQRASFLRDVSHELKTPLAAMQESASLLTDGVAGPLSRQQEEIVRIQGKNCQRLRTLIDDLLRYNAESFALLNAMPGPVRLDTLIRTVISDNELTLATGGITIHCELDKAVVTGNAEQLRVVIDNLLTNAARFSPQGGEITLHLQRDGAMVRLDIRDQGPGIDPAETEKIFEAFYQGRQPGTRARQGSGLGLAIVREYMQVNEGRIEVVQDGEGAHFRLLFPSRTPE